MVVELELEEEGDTLNKGWLVAIGYRITATADDDDVDEKKG